MILTKEQIEEIKVRADKATEGPMFAGYEAGYKERNTRPSEDSLVWTISKDPKQAGWVNDSNCEEYGLLYDDANFYAHARTDVPALIESHEQLHWQVENWERKEVDRASSCWEHEKEYVQLLVECAIPLEVLYQEEGTKKYLSPSLNENIKNCVEKIRDVVKGYVSKNPF